MPQNKGSFFFTRLYDRGLDWYEAFFRDGSAHRAAGESCEDYLSSPEALERIRAYRPDMRLVCSLRNPYERALSAWQFFGRNGIAEPTLREQGKVRPDVFSMGYYASHLRTVYSLFPEEQILVFLYDELAADPCGVVERLYQFIGVNPRFAPPSCYRVVNQNGLPRIPAVARLVHNVHMHSWGRSRLVSNMVGAIKSVRPLRQAVKVALYKEQPAAVDWSNHLAEFPEEVVARYEEEISALERMLGRDLSHWHAPSGAGATRTVEMERDFSC